MNKIIERITISFYVIIALPAIFISMVSFPITYWIFGISPQMVAEYFICKLNKSHDYEDLFSPETAKQIRKTLKMGEEMKADMEKYENTKGIK